MDTNSTAAPATTSEIAITIGAIAAAIGTIVYSFKNIKNSDCLGGHCEQKVDNECPEPITILEIEKQVKKSMLVSNV